MAYSELIKNFDGIRDYMREFYVYGFKSRAKFTKTSVRSYDDERRRIESWLGNYMCFRQMPDGKNVFLSIDSRTSHHNPLYKAWKAKSFTDGDITLHFLIFDILFAPNTKLSINELTDEIDARISGFESPKTFDVSTVRKKLKEYIKQGIIAAEKSGKTMLYSRTSSSELDCTDALDFFSEIAPCGVIGSFLLDKMNAHDEYFAFKHHYITQAL
ncbi:MAG: WYL domain-containing protein, partial [Clostridia bacterium]